MSPWRRLLGRLGAGRPEAPAAPPVIAAGVPVLTVGEAPQAPPSPPAAADHMAMAADLVAEFEGFRATSYLCPAKVWTIGYGTTRWGDGRAVSAGEGPVDQATARRLLANDLRHADQAVADLVTVPLSPGQRAALISLIYNIGRGAFARSTLLMHLNAGRLDAAAGEFLRWNKAGGVVLGGLVRRRSAEAARFAKG
jgi:lysozyme